MSDGMRTDFDPLEAEISDLRAKIRATETRLAILTATPSWDVWERIEAHELQRQIGSLDAAIKRRHLDSRAFVEGEVVYHIRLGRGIVSHRDWDLGWSYTVEFPDYGERLFDRANESELHRSEPELDEQLMPEQPVIPRRGLTVTPDMRVIESQPDDTDVPFVPCSTHASPAETSAIVIAQVFKWRSR
jgi:hypothetical protein